MIDVGDTGLCWRSVMHDWMFDCEEIDIVSG